MVTISHLVKKYVDEHPFIAEGIVKGIISNPGLAEQLKEPFEKELKKKVKESAIVMALRRYSEEIEHKQGKKSFKKVSSQISMKSGLLVIGLEKSKELFHKLNRIYSKIDYSKGEVFNVSHGNNEVSIIAESSMYEKIKMFLDEEDYLKKEENLVSVTILFSEQYFNTPGMIFAVVRQLAWNNINIVELVSANQELSILVKKEYSARALKVLQEIMD